MTKLADFAGVYQKQGKEYVSSNGTKLIAARRKNPKVGLPSHFLLYERPETERVYFSSLYSTDHPLHFNADHDGIKYVVEVWQDRLQVVLRGK